MGKSFYTLLKDHNETNTFDFINKTVSELDSLLENHNFSVLLYMPSNLSELITQNLPAQCFLYYDNSDPKNEAAVTIILSIATSLN